MVREGEHGAAIRAHGFEQAVAVHEATIEDAHGGARRWNEAAVQEDDRGNFHDISASARKKARDFKRVSAYSRSGSESATMPPPAQYVSPASVSTAVRMARLKTA